MAKPIKRITLKSREPNKRGDHTFIALLAGWAGDYGVRWTLDGRIKGISIKYEDASGEIRTVHVPRGDAEEPCPFYFNEYDNDSDSGNRGGSRKPSNGNGKRSTKSPGKGKRKSESIDEAAAGAVEGVGEGSDPDFGGDDIPF